MIMRYLLLLIIVFTTSVCSNADVVKFEKKGKYGLKNTSTGKVVQKADYVSIVETEGGYYILSLKPKSKGGKATLGMCNSNGQLILKCMFDTIYPPRRYPNGKYRVWTDYEGKLYCYQLNPGKLLSKVPVKFVTVTDGGLTIIEKERGGSDIEDRNGKLIVENAKYVIPLRNDYFLYGQNRKKFSLLGPNGEELGDQKYRREMVIVKEISPEITNGLYGDKYAVYGQDVIVITKDTGSWVAVGYIEDENGERKYGAINYDQGTSYSNGKVIPVIPFEYKTVEVNFQDMRLGGHHNSLGDRMVLSITLDHPMKHEWVNFLKRRKLYNKMLEVKCTDGTVTKYDENCKIITPENDPERIPDVIRCGNYEIFRNGELWGLRTKGGAILLQPIYSKVSPNNGQEVLYYDVVPGTDNFWVKTSGKIGVYNANLRKFIVPLSDWKTVRSDYAFNGYQCFGSNGSEIYYLNNGAKITGPFQRIVRVLDYGTAVKKNNKWGFIDRNGRQTIPCKYDKFGDDVIGWSSKLIFMDVKSDGITYYIYNYKGGLVVSKYFHDYQQRMQEQFLRKYCM